MASTEEKSVMEHSAHISLKVRLILGERFRFFANIPYIGCIVAWVNLISGGAFLTSRGEHHCAEVSLNGTKLLRRPNTSLVERLDGATWFSLTELWWTFQKLERF